MELSYTKRVDYPLPDLFIAEQSCIGKYGMLRKTFLKRHRLATCTALFLSGVLSKHLEDTDRPTHDRSSCWPGEWLKLRAVTGSVESSQLNGMDSTDE